VQRDAQALIVLLATWCCCGGRFNSPAQSSSFDSISVVASALTVLFPRFNSKLSAFAASEMVGRYHLWLHKVLLGVLDVVNSTLRPVVVLLVIAAVSSDDQKTARCMNAATI
jgi:hypothetical protein